MGGGAVGRLDFDGQQAVSRFDNEVDLLAYRRAPVEGLSTVEPCVSPGQQIVQDEVLQMSAPGLGFLREVQRHPGVTPIELRRLDQPFDAVDCIGGKAHQEVRRFEQVEIAMNLWLRQRHVTTKLRLVDELAHAQAGRSHQPPEVGQCRDRRELLQGAFQVGSHVAVKPDRPVLNGGLGGESHSGAPASASPPVPLDGSPPSRATPRPGRQAIPPRRLRARGPAARAGSSARGSNDSPGPRGTRRPGA